MSLPLPNWGSESRPQQDLDELDAIQQSEPPQHSNHASRLSDAAAATIKSLPPTKGRHRGPPNPSPPRTERRTSHHPRDSLSQSPKNKQGSSNETTTERPPNTIGSFRSLNSSHKGFPDVETHVTYSQHNLSQTINRPVGPTSEADLPRPCRHDPSTNFQARFGGGSRQHKSNPIFYHAVGDQRPSHDSGPGSRSEALPPRPHNQHPSKRSQPRSGPGPGTRGYYRNDESSTGYAGRSMRSEPRAPSVLTDTRDTRSFGRRRQGFRLPWRRREAPRCLQWAVAICTIVLVLLVILLIVLEFVVFRRKPTKPDLITAQQRVTGGWKDMEQPLGLDVFQYRSPSGDVLNARFESSCGSDQVLGVWNRRLSKLPNTACSLAGSILRPGSKVICRLISRMLSSRMTISPL